METAAQIKLGDILKVVNEGTRIFRGGWDAVDYVIPAGGEDYLPFEAVKLFFGDPRATQSTRTLKDSRGLVGFLPDRPTEVRRLRLLYGHGFGDYTGQEGPGVVWEADRIPHMKVTTLKGERVWTVLDDPAGTSVMPASSTVADESALRETVVTQGRLLDALMRRLGIDSVEEIEAPNVYDPQTDDIIPKAISDEVDPEIYDELPEDR